MLFSCKSKTITERSTDISYINGRIKDTRHHHDSNNGERERERQAKIHSNLRIVFFCSLSVSFLCQIYSLHILQYRFVSLYSMFNLFLLFTSLCLSVFILKCKQQQRCEQEEEAKSTHEKCKCNNLYLKQ